MSEILKIIISTRNIHDQDSQSKENLAESLKILNKIIETIS